METKDPHSDEAGTERERSGSPSSLPANVVLFPRDWFGPPEELVPFGPAASRTTATDSPGSFVEDPSPRLDSPRQLHPDDFWGGSAPIHDILDEPDADDGPSQAHLGDPTRSGLPWLRSPASRPALVAAFAVVVAACAIPVLSKLGGSPSVSASRISPLAQRYAGALQATAVSPDRMLIRAGAARRRPASSQTAAARSRTHIPRPHRNSSRPAASSRNVPVVSSGSGTATPFRGNVTTSNTPQATGVVRYSGSPQGTLAVGSGGGGSPAGGTADTTDSSVGSGGSAGGGGSTGSAGGGGSTGSAGPQGPGAPFGPGHLG